MLETWGKVPEYVREHHQNFQNQEKTGNASKLLKKRKGGKLESVRIKVVYGNTEDVKAKLGCPYSLY